MATARLAGGQMVTLSPRRLAEQPLHIFSRLERRVL
jgi:hypothetical protein